MCRLSPTARHFHELTHSAWCTSQRSDCCLRCILALSVAGSLGWWVLGQLDGLNTLHLVICNLMFVGLDRIFLCAQCLLGARCRHTGAAPAPHRCALSHCALKITTFFDANLVLANLFAPAGMASFRPSSAGAHMALLFLKSSSSSTPCTASRSCLDMHVALRSPSPGVRARSRVRALVLYVRQF